MHSGRRQKIKREAKKSGSKRVQKEMYGKLMFIALITNIHFGTPLCPQSLYDGVMVLVYIYV